MTIEQFEQAKREFTEKIVPVIINASLLCNTEEIIEAFTGDLTALLEQHKEVIKEDLRQKLLSMRSTKEEMDKLDKEDRLMQYGYHDCINEMLMWLKNVNK